MLQGANGAVLHAHAYLVDGVFLDVFLYRVAGPAAAYSAQYRGCRAAIAAAYLVAQYAAEHTAGHHAYAAALAGAGDGGDGLDGAATGANGFGWGWGLGLGWGWGLGEHLRSGGRLRSCGGRRSAMRGGCLGLGCGAAGWRVSALILILSLILIFPGYRFCSIFRSWLRIVFLG